MNPIEYFLPLNNSLNCNVCYPYRGTSQISTEADGRIWTEETSSVRNYHPPQGMNRSATATNLPSTKPRDIPVVHSDLESWLNEPEQKSKTEDYFSRIVADNANRPG